MPTITEVLMAPGQWGLDLDYAPEILPELISGRHIFVYEGERLAFPPLVITKPHRGGEEGITIEGQNPYWWLGQDNDGSVIEDRWYLSGKSRLSNGDFSLFGADETDPQYWKLADGTKWSIAPGAATVTADSADPDKDDVLSGDDPSQSEAEAGDELEVEVTVDRPTGAGPGRLRGRVALSGHFDTPDLLADLDFGVDWIKDDSDEPADINVVDADNVIIGPVTRPQVVVNGSFETGDLTGWSIAGGSFAGAVVSGTAFEANNSLSIIEAAAGTNILEQDTGRTVKAGEQWTFDAAVASDGAANGHYIVQYIISTKGSGPIISGEAAGLRSGWSHEQKAVDIPADVPNDTPLKISIIEFDQTAGTIYVDFIRATRTKGNTAKFKTPPISVTPGETLNLTAPVTGSWPESGPSRDGTIEWSILMQGLGRPDRVVVSTSIDTSKAATQTDLTMTITPPSGYDTITISVVATDLVGGNVSLGRPRMRRQDASRYIVDLVMGPTISTLSTFTKSITAPAGTQGVDVDLVVESEGAGYEVTKVSLTRTDKAPASVADIVRDCLKNQLTGHSLISEGSIAGDDVPLADWHVVNQTNRQVLFAIAEGGKALPFREHRINADMTLDFDLAENLFADHDGGDGNEPLIFETTDIEVQELPDVEHSDETRVERVKVVGASRPSARQLVPIQITGLAETETTEILDYFGNPSTRTRVLADSSSTSPTIANERAGLELENQGRQQQAITVTCSDLRARGVDPRPGDWVYPHRPDIELEDLTNPMQRDGRTVFPVRTRIQARTTKCGEDYRFELRRPDGTLVDGFDDLVRKEAQTSIELQLGDHVPDFAVDPQGGDAGRQLTNYLKSLAG